MRRRSLLAGATAALALAPRRAPVRGDAAEAPVVGFLALAAEPSHAADLEGLLHGLGRLGRVVGRTVLVEARYADGTMGCFRGLVDELVTQRGARVLVVPGVAAALAVRRRAPAVPVVAVGLPSTPTHPDLFASLHRPGGSVTGFSHFGEDLAEKRVELLKQVVPGLATVAILHNAVDRLYRSWGERTEEAARRQGLRPVRLGLTEPSAAELAGRMEEVRAAGAQGLVVVRDFLTHTLQDGIVRAANGLRVPTMSEQRSFVEAGGLLSYGASFPDLFPRAATYVDEILEGADPAGMPIQLSTEFELVVNLGTARALGVTVPPSVLLRADGLVE